MSRKRGKKPKAAVEAVPDDILAEGSGPVGGGARAGAALGADAISTVEDVVTTADIATTEDVVTADDVVATEEPAQGEDASHHRGTLRAADATTLQPNDGATATAPAELDALGMAVASGLDLSDAASGDGDGRGADDGSDGSDGDAGDGNGDGDGGGDDSDDDAAIVFPTSAAGMDATQLKHLVEALVFASDRPLTVQRLRQLTRVSEVRRLEHALAEIAEDYRERGLLLQQVSGGYQFRTRTQFSPWVQQLIAGRPVRLSRAQLETLAIIAYRQPITRPEIDDIRGVDSSATLKLLIDRMLIRVLGKREEVGRPILYGTTKEFLDFFSLGDLRELPTLREYSELTAESRKVMSDRLGIEPDGSSSDADLGNGTGHPAGHVGADGAHGRGTNGRGTNGRGTNGQGSNGHGTNGHGSNEHENDENERGASGRGANMRSANDDGANDDGTNDDGANDDGANMRGAHEDDANHHSAHDDGANDDGANMRSANDDGANMRGAHDDDVNHHSANGRGASGRGANGHGPNDHGANEPADDEPFDDDGPAVLASAMDLADAAAPLLSADEAAEPPTAIEPGELGGDHGDAEAAPASDAEPSAD